MRVFFAFYIKKIPVLKHAYRDAIHLAIASLNNIDYFKLKNITSIYVNEEIKLMNNSDMNSIISEYGFDNSISNYKKHYKILDNINLIMLTYNIINIMIIIILIINFLKFHY
mgnify:CR=1 FL=1